MSNHKSEYVLRSLQKIIKKKWEFYIISRIIHKLDDPEIEFITQQLVRLKNGKRALTDLYLPQFNINLEIDEPSLYHESDIDNKREQDIIFRTDHDIFRIKISEGDGDISIINSKTDEFINKLEGQKKKLVKSGEFYPWDFENQYNPERFIEKGCFEISDNVLFRKQIDAMRCFGFTGLGWQRGTWSVPDGSGDWLWFPRLFEHGMWHNELCEEGKVIREGAINENGMTSIQKQISDHRKHPDRHLITFAKAKDALGQNLLRYVGTFKANLPESSDTCIKFDRVRTSENLRRNKIP